MSKKKRNLQRYHARQRKNAANVHLNVPRNKYADKSRAAQVRREMGLDGDSRYGPSRSSLDDQCDDNERD